MLILGAAQARCATELRVLTLIETKVEGYITNDIVSNLEQRLALLDSHFFLYIYHFIFGNFRKYAYCHIFLMYSTVSE